MSAVDAAAQASLTVTDNAARRISQILASEAPESVLRVSVEGGGCSGFQYRFDVTRERETDDLVIEKAGATIVVDPVSLDYLSGSRLDFVDDLIGAAFRIDNPHATASCGCGTSFAL
ncbi:iron-sulfur cluster insertion protein ErpA [Aquabacter spiritensis]|uniref:Iron-sulfur cluster assembly accessory protein n=1 Tax=Aquabacter spiritensis TaxID=933073 RepID=A0A4R3LQS1_9HYPH|nr:iron-sulfur cluster insertion protein ErpA [Aquabacter spiritensis]TCT02853.1 iron-sulfur cluster assembly accessory protein [Aquabacter spiritensis]